MPRRSRECMYKSFNVLLLEAYNVNVLSVAIFALVFTSRVTFVIVDGSCSIDECIMEDGGGRNPTSLSAEVQDGGRRSPKSAAPMIENVHSALETSNEKPVAIPGCHWKWPFDLIHRNRSRHSSDLPLTGLKLLVVGSTLNGGLIDVPGFILDAFIVLILRRNKGRLQYGYRMLPYNGGDPASWDGETDKIPVRSFWEIVDCLLALGMTPVMSMIGMSAGVDRCLSVLAHSSDAQRDS